MRNFTFNTAVKARKAMRTAKILMIGAAFGAIATAMLLDNRAGAVMKAFNNPQAVNAAQISTEVINK